MSQTDIIGDAAPRVQVIVESGDGELGDAFDEIDGPQRTRSSDDTTSVIGGLALMIALLFVLLVAANGQRAEVPTAAEELGTTTTTVDSLSTSTSSIAVLPAAEDGELVRWPSPPDDYEPRVMGWPSQPIGTEVATGTVVYVNTIGRPTILDLAGGFQSEVDVSPTRMSETFLIEAGRIVTKESGRALPEATDDAIEILVQRDAEGPTDAQAGLMLSIRPPAARLLDGWGLEALTALFGASDLDEERWTTFVLGESGEETFRLPTPDPTTAVWIIESS